MPEVKGQPEKVEALRTLIESRRDAIVGGLPEVMKKQAARFMQVAMTSALHPDLLGCDPISICDAIFKASQSGLQLDGTHAALVPYNEKAGKRAKFVAMFQGLVSAGLESGGASAIWSRVVYKADKFRAIDGSKPRLIHERLDIEGKVDDALGAYACATLKSGATIFEYMPRAEILRIKARSKAGKGPWSNPEDECEMWRKTVVRRLMKYVPKGADSRLQRILDLDEEFDDLEPREAEYEDVASETFQRPAATGGKRDLSDLTGKNPQDMTEANAAKKPEAGSSAPAGEKKPNGNGSHAPTEKPLTESFEGPERWFGGVQIFLVEHVDDWAGRLIGKNGGDVLAPLTWASAAVSTDPKVQEAVTRKLEEGAAKQRDTGRAGLGFQMLAEVCRVAAEARRAPSQEPRDELFG